MKIERIGKTTGRFADYRMIVNDQDIGRIHRKVVKGKDGNAGRGQPAYDVWAIQGTECPSRDRAEGLLIERAKRWADKQ